MLVQSVYGGVGLAAVQLTKILEAEGYVTVSIEEFNIPRRSSTPETILS